MDLSDRKRRILNAVVRLYTDSGDPVGSHVLTVFLQELAVSSATLRNEMAEMTSLGLLEQPHTSAGRVPTNEGIRYYIDNILQQNPLQPREKRAIENTVYAMDSDPEKAAEASAKRLADALQLAAVATTPSGDTDGIVHFELVRVGRYNLAVLGVTALGSVKSRVCRVHSELAEDALSKITAALNQKLVFVSGEDISRDMVDNIGHALGGLRAEAQPVIEAACTLIAQSNEIKVFAAGAQNLLHYRELDGSMREILELFSDTELLSRLLARCTDDIAVFVGEELGLSGVSGLAAVAGCYRAGGGRLGAIGVVGPTRMNYDVVIPRLKYYCETVSALLTKGA